MAVVREVRFLVSWGEVLPQPSRHDSWMVAGLLHLALLVLILIHPTVFSARELTPEEAEHQLTLLYLPSDLLAIPEPRTDPDLTEEERRRAVIHSPITVDPQELRRILPPPLPPGTSPSLPTPPAGGEEPSSSSPAEERRREMARLQDLPGRDRGRDSSTLELPSVRPGRSLEDLLRQGPPGPAGPGGAPGELGYPLKPNFDARFPVILSDTRGVDFTPYLARVVADVPRNWYVVIPESARVLGEQGFVVIVFTIEKDGSVPLGQPKLARSSGRSHLDRPALGAIRASQPFPALPSEFTGDHIVLQFTFLYNLPYDALP